jgi:hypothetical protein
MVREGSVISHKTLERVRFVGCNTVTAVHSEDRPVFRDLRLRKVQALGSHLNASVLQNVELDGFKGDGFSMFVNGCEFENVVIRGDVGTLIIQRYLTGVDSETAEKYLGWLDKADASDGWSLDISDAVGALDIRGYPSRRIKTNPEIHAVLSREAAQTVDWSLVDFGESYFRQVIDDLLEGNWEDVILIANPKDRKAFPSDMRVIDELRQRGVAK